MKCEFYFSFDEIREAMACYIRDRHGVDAKMEDAALSANPFDSTKRGEAAGVVFVGKDPTPDFEPAE